MVGVQHGGQGDILVRDDTEGLEYSFETLSRPNLETLNHTNGFTFPVDTAFEYDAKTIRFPFNASVYIRDSEGNSIGSCFEGSTRLGEGTYQLEFSTRLKTYLLVEGPLTIDVRIGTGDDVTTIISFQSNSRVRHGVRSPHTQASHSITTTADVEDLMAAVSHFGGAIKEHSPERSFQTLRGHPPILEVGDELDIPSDLSRPDTGITIEIPRTYAHIYAVTPLAYYLGATVVPGDKAQITTDTGYTHSLQARDGFEAEVDRVFQQIFLLDGVTRSVGYYSSHPPRQAKQLDSELPFEYETVYDLAPAEQLSTYMEVPWTTVEEYVPLWMVQTTVPTTPLTIEYLPHLANQLSLVHTRPTSPRHQVVSDGGTETHDLLTIQGEFDPELLTDHAWVGEDVPPGVTHVLREGFENRHNHEPAAESPDVAVVCTDEDMMDEGQAVIDAYKSRDDINTKVDVFTNATQDDVREALQGDYQLFHYIGHTTNHGFDCRDGVVSGDCISEVNATVFLLNSCGSSSLGEALVKNGSVGGIATLSKVPNNAAVAMGQRLARLIADGYPLRQAYLVAAKQSQFGAGYRVIGNGNIQAVQQHTGKFPTLTHSRSLSDGSYELQVAFHGTAHLGMGALSNLRGLGENETQRTYLSPTVAGPLTATPDELIAYIEDDWPPFVHNGQLYTSRRDVVDKIRDEIEQV